MYKKIIAILMSCVMLVSISPAVAAEDAPVKPTVEEILNDFHRKNFAAESADNGDTAAAYSRSTGSGNDSLVQETVDTLNAAGYEAYHVTASNYDTLEAQLKTDFTGMGLDPNGSYIVTISGEDSTANPNSRAYGDNLITPTTDPGSEPSGGTLFLYTYEGITYNMRYVTVTLADTSMPLKQDFVFEVTKAENSSTWNSIFDAVFGIVLDEVLGDYAAIAPSANSAVNKVLGKPATVQNFTGFTITGSTVWTLQYIEVYNFAESEWYPAQRSEYAISACTPLIWVYDSSQQSLTMEEGSLTSFRTYSELYNDLESRKRIAAECYKDRTPDFEDSTDEITFCVKDPFSGTQFLIEGSYEFIQEHWIWSYDP